MPSLSRSDVARTLAAAEFAARAHAKQHRKYTGEPYVVHPLHVAQLLVEDGADGDTVVAGVLHDILEDCPWVKPSDIDREFGEPVLRLVIQVSKIHTEGDRASKVSANNIHFANASPEGQTIKLADMVDNLRTLVMRDPSFAKLYMIEKRHLLALMHRGSPRLYVEAKRIVSEFFAMEARQGKST